MLEDDEKEEADVHEDESEDEVDEQEDEEDDDEDVDALSSSWSDKDEGVPLRRALGSAAYSFSDKHPVSRFSALASSVARFLPPVPRDEDRALYCSANLLLATAF